MQMGRLILKEPGIDFYLESVEELAGAVTALVLQADLDCTGLGNWDHRDLRQQNESA